MFQEPKNSKAIEALRTRLRALYATLSTEKRKLVTEQLKKRLDEVREELGQLIDNFLLLATKKHDLRKQDFEERRATHEKMRAWIEKRHDAIRVYYEELKEKKNRINKAGFTAFAIGFLNVVGWTTLVAAGWFYSVFLVNRVTLNSEDYFSFVFRRIFLFGDTIFTQSGPLVIFGLFLAIWVGLLFLVTLVAWLSRWLFERDRRSELEWLVLQTGAPPKQVTRRWLRRLSQRPGTFYTQWVQVLPRVFIVGLVLILLMLFSYGSQPDDVEALLKSLSGEFIGTLFALAVTGLVVLYLSFVVEPRWARLSEKSSVWAVFLAHIELISSVVLFLVLGGLMLMLGTDQDPLIASLSFLVLVLFAAFTLGSG